MRHHPFRAAPLALATVLFLLTVCVAAAADVGPQLKALKAVGPEGAGNTAASAAWKQLAQADAAALPTILASLDDAGPLAANWIRAAVESIGERQLRTGGKLPVKELEKFTLDTKHAPRARRLAYEWLCRGDSTAADRLLPGMLQDPSIEFRRDAVARLLDEAEGLETATKDMADKAPQVAAVYRKALSGARDLDQVQQIVKKLEGFGDKVDVPAHFGYVTQWKLIGPFDNTDEKGFDVVYPPEHELNFTAEYPGKSATVKWVDHASDDPYGKVDLNKAIDKTNGVVAYAASEFESDVARPVELRCASVNALKIWLNGETVGAYKVYHAGEKMDQYVGTAKLKRGKNVILVKILQNEQKEDWAQDWEFKLRVCDAAGTAVLSKDRTAATKPQASAAGAVEKATVAK